MLASTMTSPPTKRMCMVSCSVTERADEMVVDSVVKSTVSLEPAMTRAMYLVPATGRRTVRERRVKLEMTCTRSVGDAAHAAGRVLSSKPRVLQRA